MVDESILNKIRKCFAMAEDSRGNPAEAEAALRQANKLMAKYGIDSLDVVSAGVMRFVIRSKVSVKKPMAWETMIFGKIAASNGCMAVWTSGGPEPTNKGHWTLYGPKAYVEIAEYSLVVLTRQLLASRTKYVAGLPEYYSRGDKSNYANSFCLAWVQTVTANITAMEDPDGKIEAMREAYMKKHGLSFGKFQPKGADHYNGARDAGEAAAAGVSLHKGAGHAQKGQLKIGN